MSRLNGRVFYHGVPRTKEGRRSRLHQLVKSRTKKIEWKDGKVRRFCDGVLTWAERYAPVQCAECGYDFGFFDICERNMQHIKDHCCDLSPAPMTAPEELKFWNVNPDDPEDLEYWKATRKDHGRM